MLVITKFLFLPRTLNSWCEYQMTYPTLLPESASDWTCLKAISTYRPQPDVLLLLCSLSWWLVPPPAQPPSNATSMLGDIWILLFPPLPINPQSPTSHHLSWPLHSHCHHLSSRPHHLLPEHCSGLPAPYLWTILLPECCFLFLYFLFVRESVHFWIHFFLMLYVKYIAEYRA